MEAIKFKPEFEEKLQKLGVKEKFVNNIIAQSTMRGSPNFIIRYAKEEEHENWKYFIKGSFVWFESPEKHDFWEEIANS